MKIASYIQSPQVMNTDRGHSPQIWGDWDIDGIQGQQNEFRGATYFYEDFNMLGNAVMSSAYQGSIGRWSVYASAGAVLADPQLEGGGVTYGSDGDNEGVTLLSSAGSCRLVTTSTLAPNQRFAFECRVATSTVVATKHEDFVGMAIPALSSGLPRANYPITTTDDTLDNTNGTFIGFHRKATANPTDWQFCFNLAGGTVNYVQNLTTLLATVQTLQALPVISPLVANQFVKLGFVFDPQALTSYVGASPTARQTSGQLARKIIRVFVNGFELPTFLSNLDVYNATAAQAFPTGFMSPCIASMNQTGTTPGTSTVNWIECAQMPNS